MFTFEDLRVYKEASIFVSLVYQLSDSFPKDELFALTSQFRRAAVSIMLNIAEGSSRGKKEFNHFLDLSRGSCFECVAVIEVAHNRKYLNKQQYEDLRNSLVILSKMLSGLKSSLT